MEEKKNAVVAAMTKPSRLVIAIRRRRRPKWKPHARVGSPLSQAACENASIPALVAAQARDNVSTSLNG
jgi:hypothetical protein